MNFQQFTEAVKLTQRQRAHYEKLERSEAGEPEPRPGLLPSTVDNLKSRLRAFQTLRRAGKEPNYKKPLGENMNFQEFLASKQALALVEHMDTLSEQDAQELFESLDAETIEFVEAVLSEITAKTHKRKARDYTDDLLAGKTGAGLPKDDPRATSGMTFIQANSAYHQRGGRDPNLARKDRRADQKSNTKATRREEQGKSDVRGSQSAVSLNDLRSNVHSSQDARQASKFPQK